MKQSFEEQVGEFIRQAVNGEIYIPTAVEGIVRLHQEEVAESKDLLETTIKYKSNYIGQLEAQVAELQKELTSYMELSIIESRRVAELTEEKAKYRELLELVVGFCVAFREDKPCWADHQDVGILFAKVTTALHPTTKEKPE